MAKEYREFRGVEGLVIAKVTKDDSTGYTTGEVMDLSGISELEKSSEVSNETKYYDNIPAMVISAEGADEVTMQCSVLTLEQEAFINGKIYDATLGAYIDGERAENYFAMGYKTKDTSGNYRYVWRYKGTMAIGSDTHATEDDGTDGNGIELTYTGIKTAYAFTKGGNCKGIVVDVEAGKADVSAFFDTVITPDQLTAAK